MSALARRITTIQETTDMKFQSFHTDFSLSQLALTQIIQEGLKDMSYQRTLDMREIQNQVTATRPPLSPLPPVSFLGSPDVRSTTSSLGDPPASCDTSISVPESTGSSHKPDPPEIIQVAPVRPTRPKSTPRPTQTTTPVPVSPPISETPLPQPIPLPPTIIVKTQKDPTPLSFKSFKKDNSYSDFKTACLIRANTDTYFSNLVTKNDKGRLIWNKDSTEKESQTLHLATTTSMGVNATNLIDRSDHSPCGIALWNTLDKHFLKSYTSLALKDKLKKEYEQIRKDSNESYSKYVSRVESKIEQLEYNEIKAGGCGKIDS